MSTREYILISIVVIFCLFVLFEAIRNLRYNRFQKNMRVTDKCLFKTDSCWEPGRITAIFDQTIIIEDENGEAHGLNRTEVRPFSKIW
jgi:hypothetical protein